MTHPIVSEPLSHPQGEPIRSAVERIAAFAAAARPAELTSGIRHRFKRNILDSLGCANSSRNTGHRAGAH
jgi:2-methylcitrate dehydratase PrpD